jgi:hypothetical protein
MAMLFASHPVSKRVRAPSLTVLVCVASSCGAHLVVTLRRLFELTRDLTDNSKNAQRALETALIIMRRVLWIALLLFAARFGISQ